MTAGSSARKFTLQVCMERASRFTSRVEFRKNDKPAYSACCRNGWVDLCCSHMTPRKTMRTKDDCAREASKYESRSQFKHLDPNTYSSSLKNGWLDDVCSHMRPKSTLAERSIYEIWSIDAAVVYVGLSSNPVRRLAEHRTSGRNGVADMVRRGARFLFGPPIGLMAAQQEERRLIQLYRDLGIHVLNIAKGGALGGKRLKWTQEKCLQEALMYVTPTAFQKRAPGAYDAAYRNGWLSLCYQHMMPSDFTGTIEDCRAIALRYKTKMEFRRAHPLTYDGAYRRGWIADVCAHMPKHIYTGRPRRPQQ